MKYYLKILILALGFQCCTGDQKMVNIQSNGKLTIIDSTLLTENLRSYNDTDNYGIYPIYYAGELIDTITFSKSQIPRYGHGEKSYYAHKRIRNADSETLSLFVDTSFNLAHNINIKGNLNNELSINSSDSIVSYKCFAIIITNISDSLIYLSDCWLIENIIMQAKNEYGQWVDIEKPYKFFCGTGCRPIIMEPKQIVLLKMMRYEGQFMTECRLKYSKRENTIYSNSFVEKNK